MYANNDLLRLDLDNDYASVVGHDNQGSCILATHGNASEQGGIICPFAMYIRAANCETVLLL